MASPTSGCPSHVVQNEKYLFLLVCYKNVWLTFLDPCVPAPPRNAVMTLLSESDHTIHRAPLAAVCRVDRFLMTICDKFWGKIFYRAKVGDTGKRIILAPSINKSVFTVIPRL